METLFVPSLQPGAKHAIILQSFDDLERSGSLLIINDHDPKPLYYELIEKKGNIFTWNYLENGPDVWKVQIIKNDLQAEETVAEMVTKDIAKAEVFKKYGIDFCCGGKKSLDKACEEKGVPVSLLRSELENASALPGKKGNEYHRWSPDFLADYIYNQHHLYYYTESPVINELMVKVAGHHGKAFPELLLLNDLFIRLLEELDTHFIREEKVLFPFIKALVQAQRTGDVASLKGLPSLTESVQMMEADHDAAGEILAEMRRLASDYVPAAGACNSFRLLYKKLSDLEDDLHIHIHLENNILFPMALKIEKVLHVVA